MTSSPGFNHPLRIGKTLTVGCAKCQIAHGDLTDADTSQTLTFNTLAVGAGEEAMPTNAIVIGAFFNIITAFSGGAVSACVARLGDVAITDELIEDISIFTGASGLKPKTGVYTLLTFESAYAPLITVTTTDGDCADLTAGLMEVYILYIKVSTDQVTAV